ncbi:MAG: ABC transporter transmembrane domain-containing protein [Alphaproteobacteria bacterium]
MHPAVDSQKASNGERLRPLRQIAPYLKPYRPAMAGAAIALIVAAGTVLAVGSGLRAVVDQGFITANPAMLDHALLTLLVMIVLLSIATYMRFSLVSWLGVRIVSDLQRALYSHMLKLDPGFFETARSGDILARLSADTAILQTVVGSSVSMALRNFLLLAGGMIMLIVTSGKLTLLVLVVTPLAVAPIVVIGRRVRRHAKNTQERVADIASYAEETVHGIKTVQANTHEARARERFYACVEDATAAAMRRIRARALMSMLVIALVFSAIGMVLWAGGHDVLTGRMTAGQLSSFIFYAVLVAGAVGALSEVMGDLHQAAGATERIFELLAVAPAIAAPPSPMPMPEPPRGSIDFKDVTFSYPSRPSQPALQELGFAVQAGERLALVGPSGAGKTTIFQLLLRFYDPQQGSIAIDGVDISKADPAEVRRRIGLVAQDPVIFSANAWDNIRYGRPEASDVEVMDAARAAHADEFLLRLPDGLDSFLGEKGVRLSGGQRQRIAIARAILRNPPILLLDEATSALDAESERLVQNALEKLMRNRTTLVIAHRLATVVSADRIAVMEDGRLVTTGKHHELIEEGGLYARLAALQFNKDISFDRQAGLL